MPRLSQYQNVFRVAKHDVAANSKSGGTQLRATKRNRQSVSCGACRTRKLKCDRQLPCVTCSKRGDAASCNYSNSGTSGCKGRGKHLLTSEVPLRLQKLEQMVTSLMQTAWDNSQNHTEKTPPYSEIVNQPLKNLSIQVSPRISKACLGGYLDAKGSGTNYLGGTHWTTILQNIRDIQGCFEPDIEDREESTLSSIPDGPDILCGTTQALTLADVCNSLPSRPVVDKLLSAYFHREHHQNPIIHRGKFLREVDAFWTNPSCISFLWISMLFSALWLASQICQSDSQEGSESPDGPGRAAFFTRAGQALVAGRYHKARPYSVEAVILYGQCKYKKIENQDADAWMIMGIGTRLALRMGYHRDARHLTNISPFEGEMRRRTFSVLQTFDLLFSFQAGLPPTILEEECDTEPPSNLFDEDFDEDTKVLPASRPPTDSTPMPWYCYKCRFSKIFGRVIRHALSLKIPSYEDTMKLDHEVHEMHAEVPPNLRLRPLSSSLTDPTQMVWSRLMIDLLYLKSLCVLHRTYLSHDRLNPVFDYSRKTCTDAALKILNHQAGFFIETQPRGRFFNNKWILSSLTLHDFLLAAMIICLDLYECHTKLHATSPEDREVQVKKYDTLRLSHEIWTSQRAFSQDARRVSKVLATMLSKIPRPNVSSTPVDALQQLSDVSQPSMNRGSPVGSALNVSGDSSWDAASVDVHGQDFPINNFNALDFDMTDPLKTMYDESNNIDWGIVDQYLLDRGDGDVSFDWQLPNPSE